MAQMPHLFWKNKMKTLCYSLQDAHSWAEFSGDYNPVHFDLPWVQANGGERLSVHGMRALLDIKHFSSQQVSVSEIDANSDIKCVVRIRQPLWNNIEYSLVAGSKVGTSAILTADDQKCITCNLSITEKTEVYSIKNAKKINAIELVKKQELFDTYFQQLPLWMFLDAVLFQYLIEDQTLFQQENIAVWLPKDTTFKTLFSDYFVVQTHQELRFDPTLLQPQMLEDKTVALNIDIQPAIVTGTIDSGLLVCLSLVAEYQRKFITSAITLKISSTNNLNEGMTNE